MLVLFGVGSVFTVGALAHVLEMTESVMFNELDAGFVMLTEKYIPFYPYVTLLLGTVILLIISIKISTTFYTNKEA